MRRLLFCIVFLLSSVALTVGVPIRGDAQGQPTVSIMVGGLEKIIYLPAMLTERLGYFKEAGVDVTRCNEGAGVSAEDEMLAGRVDGVVGFYDHSIDLQSKGKYVEAVIILDRVPGEALVVSNHSGITSLAGLKGKRIGVTGLGSSTNFLASFLVTKGGGSQGEYTPIPVGARNTLIAAMQQDRIDAPGWASHRIEGPGSVQQGARSWQSRSLEDVHRRIRQYGSGPQVAAYPSQG